MAYEVGNLSVKEFITDSTIKLPRFQRKATWNAKQNFQLCLSMFNSYPLGVVIYNTVVGSQGTVNLLLDGRQRRNALKQCIEDPASLYDYACKTLRFAPTDDSGEVEKRFWNEAHVFVNKETEADSSTEEDDGYPDSDIDHDQIKGNLKLLLKTILMVHGKKKSGITAWQKRWDFSKCFAYLPYIEAPDKFVNPAALRKFILEKLTTSLPTKKEDAGEKWFVDVFKKDGYPFVQGGEEQFKAIVATSCDSLIDDIITIRDVNASVYNEAKLAVIKIKNASTEDSQRIFSLINTGGTKLKAEELLSAKPFWNQEVPLEKINSQIVNKIRDLYRKMEIPGKDVPHDGNYYNWDVAATFLDRFDPSHLLFPDYEALEDKDCKLAIKKITEGFKLVTVCLEDGFSANCVLSVESHKDIAGEIAVVGKEIGVIVDELVHHDFYKRLKSWGKSIDEILGMAATLEFVAALRKQWKELGCDQGAQLKKFVRQSYVLFDRLVYEYTIGAWRGSSDSKLAKDLKVLSSRFGPVLKEDWVALIKKCCGETNEDYKTKNALLYYLVALQGKEPDGGNDVKYDIDHIIPQSEFGQLPEGTTVPKALMNSLGNMALVPRRKNQSKNDRKLSEIGDANAKKDYARFVDLKVKDFDKYSEVCNIQKMVDERMKVFLKVIEKRGDFFAGD